MERSLGLLVVALIAAANASPWDHGFGALDHRFGGRLPWVQGGMHRDIPWRRGLGADRSEMESRLMPDLNYDESSEEIAIPIWRIIEDPVPPKITDMTNAENKGTIENQINTLKQLLEVTKQESEQKINALRNDAEAAKRETEQKMKEFQQQMEALKQESELKAKVMRQNNQARDQDPEKNGFEDAAPKVTMKQRTQTVETEIKIDYNSAIEDKEVISDNEDEEASTCPNNFVSLNGRCYHFSSIDFGSWLDGSAACRELDSQSSLISLESQEEWDTIKKYITEHKLETKNWYLGGSDMDEEGTWRWKDTNRTFEFSDWCRGEPDDYKNEDCALITAVSEWYNWNNRLCWSDLNCQSVAGFKQPLHSICEITNKALNN